MSKRDQTPSDPTGTAEAPLTDVDEAVKWLSVIGCVYPHYAGNAGQVITTIARLRATQRTPGTVEVCRFGQDGNDCCWLGRGPNGTCDNPDCPIRQPTTSAGES